MPFPLSKVRYLGDYEGKFVLSVRCLACLHEKPVPAPALAQRFGAGARIDDVVRRFRCSACNSRRVDVLVAGIPR